MMVKSPLKKSTMVALAMLLAALLLFSFCFIILESSHHCEEDHCPICMLLQQSLSRIQITAIELSSVVPFPALDAHAGALSLIVALVICGTLIDHKIRLND